MTAIREKNCRLALAINAEIWNARQLEKIPEYFAADFVADYSPRVTAGGTETSSRW